MSEYMENTWNKINVYCLNHKKPKKMQVVTNLEKIKSPFFACAQYFPEKGSNECCSNRLNMDDYNNIVIKLSKTIAQNPFNNYKNYSFKHKGGKYTYSVRILQYDFDHIDIGIKNISILA